MSKIYEDLYNMDRSTRDWDYPARPVSAKPAVKDYKIAMGISVTLDWRSQLFISDT